MTDKNFITSSVCWITGQISYIAGQVINVAYLETIFTCLSIVSCLMVMVINLPTFIQVLKSMFNRLFKRK